MHLSYLGPVSCVFTSWVSSGLTLGSDCSTMAARWQVLFPSWVPSGLASSPWRAASTTDDCDILCLLIWQEILHFSLVIVHFKFFQLIDLLFCSLLFISLSGILISGIWFFFIFYFSSYWVYVLLRYLGTLNLFTIIDFKSYLNSIISLILSFVSIGWFFPQVMLYFPISWHI